MTPPLKIANAVLCFARLKNHRDAIDASAYTSDSSSIFDGFAVHHTFGPKTMRRFRFLFAFLLAPSTAGAIADDLQLPHGTVCWPLHFAGITLGISTDSHVQRLLGRGVFRATEGDTGGRYYIDKHAKATLHVVSYTDSIVGEVTISEGVSSEIAATERKKAVTPWFTPEEGFGNWHALRLGASKDDVLKNLGKPEKEISPDEWQYSVACTCELPEYFTLSFRSGRLVKIIFSAPPG